MGLGWGNCIFLSPAEVTKLSGDGVDFKSADPALLYVLEGPGSLVLRTKPSTSH